jgi:branched-chain amino acid transport system substrate-binding protein
MCGSFRGYRDFAIGGPARPKRDAGEGPFRAQYHSIAAPAATILLVPARPAIMTRCSSACSTSVNTEFHYRRCFSMLPAGPDLKHPFSQGYFNLAMMPTPKPKTVAIVAADAELARNASDGARDNAKAAGLNIVYDGTFPPTTADYSPIVRTVRAVNANIIYVASYPPAAGI